MVFLCIAAISTGQDYPDEFFLSEKEYIESMILNQGCLESPADELLRDHLANFKNRFGYEPILGEWEVFFPIMDQLAKRGDFRNAIGDGTRFRCGHQVTVSATAR